MSKEIKKMGETFGQVKRLQMVINSGRLETKTDRETSITVLSKTDKWPVSFLGTEK